MSAPLNPCSKLLAGFLSFSLVHWRCLVILSCSSLLRCPGLRYCVGIWQVTGGEEAKDRTTCRWGLLEMNKRCKCWKRSGKRWGDKKAYMRWDINTAYDSSRGYRRGGGTFKSKKGTESNVGINKESGKAYYTSGLKMQFFSFHFITESFSAHLIIQWLN